MEPNKSHENEDLQGELQAPVETDPEQAILHQDTYRKVMFGEVADPLYPPHPGPPEAEEDELTRAAMSDPAAHNLNMSNPNPTAWRIITVFGVAVLALSIVFWWMK